MEKKVLKSIYLVTFLFFLNLCFITDKIDFLPLVFGISSIILIAYGNYTIKKFFPDGDKFLFLIASLLVQFGVVMIYRLDTVSRDYKIPKFALKQMTWFTVGIAIFVIIITILPNMKILSRFKYAYVIIALSLLSSTLF